MHRIWGRIDSKIYMGGHAFVSNRDWVTLHGTVMYTYSNFFVVVMCIFCIANYLLMIIPLEWKLQNIQLRCNFLRPREVGRNLVLLTITLCIQTISYLSQQEVANLVNEFQLNGVSMIIYCNGCFQNCTGFKNYRGVTRDQTEDYLLNGQSFYPLNQQLHFFV